MSTELVDKLAAELEIPEGVTVTYKKPMITVQGPLGKHGKVSRKFQLTLKLLMVKSCLKHKEQETKTAQS